MTYNEMKYFTYIRIHMFRKIEKLLEFVKIIHLENVGPLFQV